jgi:hypothetical protein
MVVLPVALAGAATGCYQGFDPLDPEVLAEVARARGDAQGFEHSGIYVGNFEALECGCAELEARVNVSLCTLIESANMIGLGMGLDVELVQADGSVRIEALSLAGFFEEQAPLLPLLYGPLHADGRIAVAGVLQADALVVKGQVLARIDGTLDGPPGAWVLDVEYQQRYVLDLLAGGAELGAEFGGDAEEVIGTTDCRERVGMHLQWFSPPLQPVPEI